MARVVGRMTHSDALGLPLGATLRESAFKTLFLDVELVHALHGSTDSPLKTLRVSAL